MYVPTFLFMCLVGSITCAHHLHRRDTEEASETPETTVTKEPTKESGSPSFPDIGGWWTDFGNQYGPDKWRNEAQNWFDKAGSEYGPDRWTKEAQNWFDKAPAWLQFGQKKE